MDPRFLATLVLATLSASTTAYVFWPDGTDLSVEAAPVDYLSAEPVALPLTMTRVCFLVSVPGDISRAPVRVVGTLYESFFTEDEATTVVLAHGTMVTRAFWESFGTRFGSENGTTLPRALALAGHRAITYDRVGYGESPFLGFGRSGATLDVNENVEIAHQIVMQVRAGTYHLDECDGAAGEPAPGRVVFGGHSFGGLVTASYISRYDDVDGAIVMGIAPVQGVPAPIAQRMLACAVQTTTPDGYAAPVCDEAFCRDLIFHEPGAIPGMSDLLCPEPIGRTPLGEADTFLFHSMLGPTIPLTVAPIPVLFAFADEDVVTKGIERAEIEAWQMRCACAVSVDVQPDAGHGFNLHASYQHVNEALDLWLRGDAPVQGRGLGLAGLA